MIYFFLQQCTSMEFVLWSVLAFQGGLNQLRFYAVASLSCDKQTRFNTTQLLYGQVITKTTFFSLKCGVPQHLGGREQEGWVGVYPFLPQHD